MPDLMAVERLLMEQLEPLRQRYKQIGIHLVPPPGVEIVPGDTLLDSTMLAGHVSRFGERIGTTNQRIAAVHWLGQVGYAVLPPIELAMTRAGIGLDAALPNIALLQPAGQPDALLVRDLAGTVVLAERYHGPVAVTDIGRPVATSAALRHHVLDRLFGGTFQPLIERLHDVTGVSRQVLWGQVAYEADLFYQQLARSSAEARDADWEADRAALFEQMDWSVAPGPSPLYAPTRQIMTTDSATGEPAARTLRSICCLIYRVPTGRMCGACPLALKKETIGAKIATMTERRAAHGLTTTAS